MSILDELKKLTHTYEDEDEDFDEIEVLPARREPAFDDRKAKIEDRRGKVVNVAFAVSAAFVFGDHMGFTAGFAPEMLPAMILGKLAGGITAIAVSLFLTRKQ